MIPARPPLFPAVQRGVGMFFEGVLRRIHVHKHAEAMASSRVTHERPFIDGSVRLGGLTVGLTISELHSIRARHGIEFIQVVDFGRNSNLETVLWRTPIFKWMRVELQGPAINTRIDGGGIPLDFRIFGIGLTGDAIDRKSHEAVSYTAEAKLHASDLLMLMGSSVGAAMAGWMGTGAAGTLTRYLVDGCALAVPIVGGLIAVSSIRWAIRSLYTKNLPPAFKAVAVAHAVSDTVRIAFPLVGVLANAALVGVSLALQRREYAKLAHLRHERSAQRAAVKAAPASPPAAEPPNANAA